eukprot:COSAG06_NODE_45950_length_351_cov_0.305556_1_plen_79_part_10
MDPDNEEKNGIGKLEWVALKKFLLERVVKIAKQTKDSLTDETLDAFEGASGHLTYACLNLTSDLLAMGLLCDDASMKNT